MTTDRQLLEDAARAAGLTIGFVSVQLEELCFVWNDDKKTSRWWRPLTEDGDALRLAVKLRLDVIHDDPREKDTWVMVGDLESVEDVDGEASRPAATRRAIVRAAAAIGRQKEAE